MDVLLSYSPFGHGKADGASIRTEKLGIAGAADLSKRAKRAKGAAADELHHHQGAGGYSIHAYNNTSSSSNSSAVGSGDGTCCDDGSGGGAAAPSPAALPRSASFAGSDGAGAPLLLCGHDHHHLQHHHHHHHHLGAAAGGGGGGGLFSGSAAASAATSVLRFNVAGLGGGGGGGPAGVAGLLAAAAGGGGAAAAGPGLKYQKGGPNGILVDMGSMCKRLWLLAWPLSWMEVLTFTKELVITSFVGHLGAAELSALVLAQTVYNVTGNAPMLGFVTAMETFCGQAFGARRYGMVGVVLQRGLAVSLLYCCCAVTCWGWCEALLVRMGQDPTISASAASFTLALAPALFMDAADQCCRRYLSAQAVVQPLMLVTLVATLLTPFYLWLFVARFGLGLIGAAVAWDAVQATSLALMVTCCVLHTRGQEPGRCTWPGWTAEALSGWGEYIRMAVPSCVMICLDWWTFEVIVMLSGLLPNPEQTMSMMGITFNVHALCFFAAHGLSGAASTRVGNDLGGGRPHMAWLTVQVAVLLGTVVMVASSVLLLLGRNHLGRLFTGELDVVLLTAQAVPPLAVSLIGEGANTVLAGVMRGCGRQKIGATINLVTYWVFGLPFACLLAFPGGLGALGLWTGLACTASAQALLMTLTVFRFNWVDEAARAKQLVAAGELVLEDEGDLGPLGGEGPPFGPLGGCLASGSGSSDGAGSPRCLDGGGGGAAGAAAAAGDKEHAAGRRSVTRFERYYGGGGAADGGRLLP